MKQDTRHIYVICCHPSCYFSVFRLWTFQGNDYFFCSQHLAYHGLVKQTNGRKTAVLYSKLVVEFPSSWIKQSTERLTKCCKSHKKWREPRRAVPTFFFLNVVWCYLVIFMIIFLYCFPAFWLRSNVYFYRFPKISSFSFIALLIYILIYKYEFSFL